MKGNLLFSLTSVITALSLAALACAAGGSPTEAPTAAPKPTTAPKATEAPKPTTPPVKATEAPKPTATTASVSGGDDVFISSHYSYIDNYDYLHVVGLVTNNTNETVSNIELTVQILDKDGQTILQDSDGNPAAEEELSPMLYTLSPGDSSPFDFWLYLDNVEPDTYVVTVTDVDSGQAERGELAIENAQMIADDDGDLYFSGELVNLTDAPIQVNTLAGAALDDNDTVLAADYSFSLARYLWPAGDENGNDRTPFMITMDGPADDATQWSAYWDAEIVDDEGASGIEIELGDGYFDYYDDFHMLGWATNTTNDLMNVSLVAGLYDADGVVLDANSTSIAIYLEPGQSVPWQITYFPNIGANDSEAERLDIYTVQVDRYGTYDWSFDVVALETTNDGVTNEGDGITSAAGDVTNTSGKELSYITVIVYIEDADGNLVAVDYTGLYPDGDSIKPGDTLAFDLTLYLDPSLDPADFTFSTIVQGYVK